MTPHIRLKALPRLMTAPVVTNITGRNEEQEFENINPIDKRTRGKMIVKETQEIHRTDVHIV
jgi:hypothetical protein